MKVRNETSRRVSIRDMELFLTASGTPDAERVVDVDAARTSKDLQRALGEGPHPIIPAVVSLQDMTKEERVEMGLVSESIGGETDITSAGGSANQVHAMGSAGEYACTADLADGGHAGANLTVIEGTNTVKFLVRNDAGTLLNCSSVNEKVNWNIVQI